MRLTCPAWTQHQKACRDSGCARGWCSAVDVSPCTKKTRFDFAKVSAGRISEQQRPLVDEQCKTINDSDKIITWKYWGVFSKIEINSHIGHVKDLPQGFITAVIHFDQVCSSEAVVVPVLGHLLGQTENPSLKKHSYTWVKFTFQNSAILRLFSGRY